MRQRGGYDLLESLGFMTFLHQRVIKPLLLEKAFFLQWSDTALPQVVVWVWEEGGPGLKQNATHPQ